MIWVYCDSISPRIEYVLSFVLTEQMGLSYQLTTDVVGTKAVNGPAIWYSSKEAPAAVYRVPVDGLLSEKGVAVREVTVQQVKDFPVLFPGEGDLGFDIFSAVFFLLTRYEEYLPYEADEYLRFPHNKSLAFRHGFLNRPLVNEWIIDFSLRLQVVFPGLPVKHPSPKFVPTYDIDIAWSYRHKGFMRNIGGMIRRPSLERLQVLAGRKTDPYDSYDYVDCLHEQYGLSPVYFFLISYERNRYDKNIDPSVPAMKGLIRRHAGRYTVGAHPSWASHKSTERLKNELVELSGIIQQPVTASRQHYIRMTLPETYRRLMEAGISDEYSMGYGSINGFRASVASTFYWYDLLAEKQTSLRVHPFCFMDANAFFEQGQDVDVSAEELRYYFETCRKVNGTLVSVFHNQFLGTDPLFAGWAEMYESFLDDVHRLEQA